MLDQSVRSKPGRRPAALAGVLAAAVMVMSCGSIGNISSAVGAASTAAAAISTQTGSVATGSVATGSAATPGATSAAAGAPGTVQCQTVGAAYFDFEGQYPFLGIASDSGYASNTPDSPAYINIPKLRSDLDVLGTLPDGELGAIAPAIAQIRQLVDQVAANIQSGGKPFSDGSGDGQKVLDLYLKLAEPYTVLSAAFAGACPNFTAATPAPDAAGFQMGQAAAVGDLRVTLDKVSVAPPSADPFLQPGNRYLLAHITIQNVGQSELQVTAMETSLKDAAGTVYGFDPTAGMGSDAFVDGKIPAGGSQAGVVTYQVPASAGDLLWIFQDYGSNRAVIAVKDSAIDTSNAGNAATQDALQASAGATGTAFMDMVATSQSADLTATPAP